MKNLHLFPGRSVSAAVALVVSLQCFVPTAFALTPPAAGAIAAGGSHMLVLKSDGTVWAWGANGHGQLGDGTMIDRSAPVLVAGLTGVVAIAAGAEHSLALRSDGTVWAWGCDDAYQLGDDSTTDKTGPVRVLDLAGAVAIAAGYRHSLAVKGDGTVWSWGANAAGQLANESADEFGIAPAQVDRLTGVIAVAAGNDHSLALKGDGTVWAWGGNDWGQLGDGSWASRLSPVRVRALSGIVAIAAGSYHSLALGADGTAAAWGSNESGQLGDGTWDMRNAPVPVVELTEVVAIAGNDNTTLAVRGDGGVWYCGLAPTPDNDYCLTPAPLSFFTGVVPVAANGIRLLIQQPNGIVWSWVYGEGEAETPL